MGTNYYLVKNGPSVLEPIHIGKSSGGWLFHFQNQNDQYSYSQPIVWNTWNQVRDTLKRLTVDSDEFVIMNEYDNIVPFEDFCDLVESKQKDESCIDNPDNFTDARNIDGYRFTDKWFC